MNILVLGDIVGEAGCEFVRENLPLIKKQNNIDICIANGENSAEGNGITPHSADYLLSSGIDFITTGNHVFRRGEVYSYLDETDRVIRPYNLHSSTPGSGVGKIDMGRVKIGIINLMGKAFMNSSDNPFDAVDKALEEIKDCKIKIVDFHAEATGEKRAMGFYLDGRVSAVFGTHTHIQTADCTILPKRTGYITDVGMCGPDDSVLGVESEIIIKYLKTGMPQRFKTSTNPCFINGCIFEIDDTNYMTKSVRTVKVQSLKSR
ncbi:MAG: TIGR00282 family metallophosphoesterase [Clostridia bacterium]|nr:TIGR00282 family metallophosphoesterase [Clostridia bacterium]